MPTWVQNFCTSGKSFPNFSPEFLEKADERTKHMKTHIDTRIRNAIALVLFWAAPITTTAVAWFYMTSSKDLCDSNDCATPRAHPTPYAVGYNEGCWLLCDGGLNFFQTSFQNLWIRIVKETCVAVSAVFQLGVINADGKKHLVVGVLPQIRSRIAGFWVKNPIL
jgi:hypothetical protein